MRSLNSVFSGHFPMSNVQIELKAFRLLKAAIPKYIIFTAIGIDDNVPKYCNKPTGIRTEMLMNKPLYEWREMIHNLIYSERGRVKMQ